MTAAVTAAIAALEQKNFLQNHITVFKVIINAFDKFIDIFPFRFRF